MTITTEDALHLATMARIIAIEEVLVAEGKTTRTELIKNAKAQVEETVLNEADKEQVIRFLLR